MTQEQRERYRKLAVELNDAWIGEGNGGRVGFHDWIAAAAADDRHTLQDACKEFLQLEAARVAAFNARPDVRELYGKGRVISGAGTTSLLLASPRDPLDMD